MSSPTSKMPPEKPFRLLITGSRTWLDRERIRKALTKVHLKLGKQPGTLIHGGADGVDKIAAEIWEKLGRQTELHRPDWDRYGKRAGFIRNKAMVDSGANLCLAFIRENSKGATMCAEIADKAEILTIIYREES